MPHWSTIPMTDADGDAIPTGANEARVTALRHWRAHGWMELAFFGRWPGNDDYGDRSTWGPEAIDW